LWTIQNADRGSLAVWGKLQVAIFVGVSKDAKLFARAVEPRELAASCPTFR
jgi:hypothetical protein